MTEMYGMVTDMSALFPADSGKFLSKYTLKAAIRMAFSSIVQAFSGISKRYDI